MDLKEFLRISQSPKRWNFNQWITHPGFRRLYLRYGRRFIESKVVTPVLDIANVEVLNPGNGTFKKFIALLRKEYPELNLYVENAHPRFGEGLERMGFKRLSDKHGYSVSDCYFMPAVEQK